jgi:hypothetical protein
MNWEHFIAGAMTMNILWTLIHWWFPRERKAKYLPMDINKTTYCNECQGPLALTSEEYDPTKLYTRIHSIHCSKAK